jgi:hypothetical protein
LALAPLGTFYQVFNSLKYLFEARICGIAFCLSSGSATTFSSAFSQQRQTFHNSFSGQQEPPRGGRFQMSEIIKKRISELGRVHRLDWTTAE